MLKQQLTIAEAAARTGMLPQTLRRLCRKGQLEGAVLETSPFGDPYWLIPVKTLDRWKPRKRGWPPGSRGKARAKAQEK